MEICYFVMIDWKLLSLEMKIATLSVRSSGSFSAEIIGKPREDHAEVTKKCSSDRNK